MARPGPDNSLADVQGLSIGTAEDELALGHLFTVAKRIAAQEGIAESGYRLLVNCNRDAGQEVYHLHMHIFGGRPLGPMLQKRG